MGPARIVVTRSWITVTNIDDDTLSKLISALSFKIKRFKFTRTSSGATDFIPITCCHIEEINDKRVLVARAGFLTRIRSTLQKSNIPYEIIDKVVSEGQQLTLHQSELINSLAPLQAKCVIEIIRNRGGIIHASTGFGKTYIFPVLSEIYKDAKIDIVTRRIDVANNIVREFRDKNLSVGITTSEQRFKHKRVNVYTIGCLDHSDYDADVVFADECHELVTEKAVEKLLRYKNAFMYGFSASIRREDNAHIYMEQLFGPVIFSAPYNIVINTNKIVPIVIQWIPVERPVLSDDPKWSITTFKRIMFWRNQNRNEIIAKIAKQYVQDGKQTLIITKTVEHALHLKMFLPEFALCVSSAAPKFLKNPNLRRFAQEAIESVKNRYLMARKFRNREIMAAISTEIWTTGVSFDDLEVIIRADPDISERSGIQVPGRVCRIPKLSDKEYGIVVDFVDKFNRRTLARSYLRSKLYKQMTWLQCDENMQPINSIKSLLIPASLRG